MTVKLKPGKKYRDGEGVVRLIVTRDQISNYCWCDGERLTMEDNRAMTLPYIGLQLNDAGRVVGWQDYAEDGTIPHSKYKELYFVEEVAEPTTRGTYGQFSKLEEEFAEMTEAYENNDSIALLSEASDFIGALEAFIEQHFPSLTLADLLHNSQNKKKLYVEGKLKNRDGATK